MSAASGENQSVMSPRCTSARSYSAQLLTRYFVLYLGWTLEFMLRMWPIGPKGPPRPGQFANFLYDSCTNANFPDLWKWFDERREVEKQKLDDRGITK